MLLLNEGQIIYLLIVYWLRVNYSLVSLGKILGGIKHMKKSIAVVSASLGLLSVVSPCSQAAFTVSSSSVKTPVKNGINMSSPENAKMLKSGAVAAGCFGFIGAASFILFQSNKEEKSNSVLTPKKSGGEIVSRNGEAKKNTPASEVETKKGPQSLKGQFQIFLV